MSSNKRFGPGDRVRITDLSGAVGVRLNDASINSYTTKLDPVFSTNLKSGGDFSRCRVIYVTGPFVGGLPFYLDSPYFRAHGLQNNMMVYDPDTNSIIFTRQGFCVGNKCPTCGREY